MNVHPVPLNLHLPDDQLVDLFLFQWHTPDPISSGTFQKIPSPCRGQKATVLRGFCDWFQRRSQAPGTVRPSFIVLPELSLPLDQMPIIERFLSGTRQPVVVIAGLEHVTWAEYEELVERMGNTPAGEVCPPHERMGRFLNLAAVWIRDETGSVSRFVQSKVHPSDNERPRLHPGRNVLLFRSRDQTAGRRLNFCVQICSDFCRQDNVLRLRESMESECPGLPLDFTFLPQHNPDQEATQFLEATEAYFRREPRRTVTESGCLILVNNANQQQGKSRVYGGSRLNFPHGRWRELKVPLETFWISEYPTHQAVIARESGPGIYCVSYKPHCWVGARPGGAQSEPFRVASFLPIDGENLATADLPIFPEAHWLRNEWVAGESDFSRDVQRNVEPCKGPAIAEEIAQACKAAYRSSTSEWCDYFDSCPLTTRSALNLLFWCCKSEDHFPSKEVEPQLWVRNVSACVQRMLQGYALMKLGGRGASAMPLVPDYEVNRWHARFGNEVRVLLLCGNNNRGAEAMITQAKALGLEVALLTGKVLFFLVDPGDEVAPKALRRDLTVDSGAIDRAAEIQGLGRHLMPAGSTTDAMRDRHFNVLSNRRLLQAAHHAGSEADLTTSIESVLRAELSNGEPVP